MQVLYNDGEKENLNLRKQRWQLIGGDSEDVCINFFFFFLNCIGHLSTSLIFKDLILKYIILLQFRHVYNWGKRMTRQRLMILICKSYFSSKPYFSLRGLLHYVVFGKFCLVSYMVLAAEIPFLWSGQFFLFAFVGFCTTTWAMYFYFVESHLR